MDVGWVMLLVPYALLVLKPTAGRGVVEVALRVAGLDGVSGMSCSEMAGEVPLALEALLAALVERRVVDIVGGRRAE